MAVTGHRFYDLSEKMLKANMEIWVMLTQCTVDYFTQVHEVKVFSFNQSSLSFGPELDGTPWRWLVSSATLVPISSPGLVRSSSRLGMAFGAYVALPS